MLEFYVWKRVACPRPAAARACPPPLLVKEQRLQRPLALHAYAIRRSRWRRWDTT